MWSVRGRRLRPRLRRQPGTRHALHFECLSADAATPDTLLTGRIRAGLREAWIRLLVLIAVPSDRLPAA